ncbi:RagB/SusD family nutrient uptake outer membrane protein [Gramella jeungdoensis]|uniref:RagB/SusD family nutrient uptake outer membrane protein n=2 Tax=Flavobacteriaceae TaxID=49546 RepID=A0A4Y8AVC0_9FLAO|nr:RagB/SusD family nutrient uptake outer membrane protein [Gramella jeungdoensis]
MMLDFNNFKKKYTMKNIMKNIIKIKFLVLALVFLTFGSCTEDFLDRPPEDSYNVADFYKTVDQVNTATNTLYSKPWFDYVSNVSWCIGELSSGNGRTYDARNQDFMTFAITGNHNTLGQAWTSLYAVVAQSNAIINTVPDAAGEDVPEDLVNNVVGEAKFIRATAYFYLVRIFGAIPIILDNVEYVDKAEIPRNTVEDVYALIKKDLEYAVANCYTKVRGSNYDANAKVSSGSAKAMLAKIYLYEENYQMAYSLSNEVISSGEFKLLGGTEEDGYPGSYYDLFLTKNDNNPETIFSLQWGTSGEYAEGNAVQSLYGASGITGFSDGWAAIGPSLDLQDAYEDKVKDERYYATIMDPDSYYPDLNGGYTASSNINFQDTGVGIKKYVVGNPANLGGGAQQSYPNNTYVLRYAELLLIHAEAIIKGGGGSLAEAKRSIDKVRNRAGLDDLASDPTFEDVFQERRIELAFEMEFWFDVVRLGTTEAINYLADRERGTWNTDTDPRTVNSLQYTPTADKLLFPYPTSETINNPALLLPPVNFDFTKYN